MMKKCRKLIALGWLSIFGISGLDIHGMEPTLPDLPKCLILKISSYLGDGSASSWFALNKRHYEIGETHYKKIGETEIEKIKEIGCSIPDYEKKRKDDKFLRKIGRFHNLIRLIASKNEIEFRFPREANIKIQKILKENNENPIKYLQKTFWLETLQPIFKQENELYMHFRSTINPYEWRLLIRNYGALRFLLNELGPGYQIETWYAIHFVYFKIHCCSGQLKYPQKYDPFEKQVVHLMSSIKEWKKKEGKLFYAFMKEKKPFNTAETITLEILKEKINSYAGDLIEKNSFEVIKAFLHEINESWDIFYKSQKYLPKFVAWEEKNTDKIKENINIFLRHFLVDEFEKKLENLKLTMDKWREKEPELFNLFMKEQNILLPISLEFLKEKIKNKKKLKSFLWGLDTSWNKFCESQKEPSKEPSFNPIEFYKSQTTLSHFFPDMEKKGYKRFMKKRKKHFDVSY